MSTGVSELDIVLGGGFERGSLVVLAGAPGTGKTILAQQICFANATLEHGALYYTTLSESHSKLVKHLQPFDFFDPEALERRVEFIHLSDLLNEDFEDALGPAVNEVVRKCLDSQPSVVVIDSSKALRDFADERVLRKAIYMLANRVAPTGATLLFLGEYTPDEIASSPEFSIADAIVQLTYESYEPLDRRWLRVVKRRGAAHLEGKHSFRITSGGIEVFPRLETIAPDDPPDHIDERISTGVPKLDEMMGGGMWRTDATALMGPSGCGKTALALRFIAQGIEDGEKCVYVSFQESGDQLIKKAATFGWDLEAAVASRELVIHHVPQGRLDLDAIGAFVRGALATGSIRRVVFDSMAEMVVAAREDDRFPAYARSIVAFIRAAGASVIITSETTTLGPSAEIVGGLSFLFHNVILLRYIEIQSEIRRALVVVKMRDSAHDKGLVQFEIDETGLTIMNPLEDITGVLGWSALRRTPGE